MKPLLLLLSLVLTLFPALSSSAAEADDSPGNVTEKFYAGYVAEVDANRNTGAWVAKSKLVTDRFKKAYAKIMNSEEVDADPVLNAQDIPSAPFKTETAITKENTATVVVASSFGEDKHRLKLKLVKVDGVWLLDELPE